jgi:hypothetical protein
MEREIIPRNCPKPATKSNVETGAAGEPTPAQSSMGTAMLVVGIGGALWWMAKTQAR